MTSTMVTMGGPTLDDGMDPWLQAVGLEEWCDIFKQLGLDHIDDLGNMSPPCCLAVPSSATSVPALTLVGTGGISCE